MVVILAAGRRGGGAFLAAGMTGVEGRRGWRAEEALKYFLRPPLQWMTLPPPPPPPPPPLDPCRAEKSECVVVVVHAVAALDKFGA